MSPRDCCDLLYNEYSNENNEGEFDLSSTILGIEHFEPVV